MVLWPRFLEPPSFEANSQVYLIFSRMDICIAVCFLLASGLLVHNHECLCEGKFSWMSSFKKLKKKIKKFFFFQGDLLPTNSTITETSEATTEASTIPLSTLASVAPSKYFFRWTNFQERFFWNFEKKIFFFFPALKYTSYMVYPCTAQICEDLCDPTCYRAECRYLDRTAQTYLRLDYCYRKATWMWEKCLRDAARGLSCYNCKTPRVNCPYIWRKKVTTQVLL